MYVVCSTTLDAINDLNIVPHYQKHKPLIHTFVTGNHELRGRFEIKPFSVSTVSHRDQRT